MAQTCHLFYGIFADFQTERPHSLFFKRLLKNKKKCRVAKYFLLLFFTTLTPPVGNIKIKSEVIAELILKGCFKSPLPGTPNSPKGA